MEFEKRYNDQGQVAVLISAGYGAGWSTCSDISSQTEAMLFDSRIVDAVLTGMPEDDIVELCKSLGYDVYFGGVSGLYVEWLDEGTRFTVEEYDGAESIRTFDDLCYVA